MKACPLCDALTAMLPETVIKRRVAHDWHSVPSSGQRLIVELQTFSKSALIDDFAGTIGDHEFILPGLLVADILLMQRCACPDGSTRLIVEALVLDEEI